MKASAVLVLAQEAKDVQVFGGSGCEAPPLDKIIERVSELAGDQDVPGAWVLLGTTLMIGKNPIDREPAPLLAPRAEKVVPRFVRTVLPGLEVETPERDCDDRWAGSQRGCPPLREDDPRANQTVWFARGRGAYRVMHPGFENRCERRFTKLGEAGNLADEIGGYVVTGSGPCNRAGLEFADSLPLGVHDALAGLSEGVRAAVFRAWKLATK